jgi:N-acetylglucosamine repressor
MSTKIGKQTLLRLIQSRRATSQIELARAAQLPANTVHGVVKRLIDDGAITEERVQRAGRGRPSKHYAIRIPSNILAVELTGTQWHALVASPHPALAENVVSFQSAQIPDAKIATTYLKNIRDAALARVGKKQKDLTGIVIFANGLDLKTGHFSSSSVLPWLVTVSEASLTKEMGCPVIFTDQPPRGESELRNWTRDGIRSLVAFNVGDGVSSHFSSIVGPYAEIINLSGEIGHIAFKTDPMICGCGHRGCLETFISGPNFIRRVRSDIENGVHTALKDCVGAPPAEFFQHLESIERTNDDPYATTVVNELLSHCAWGLSVALNMFRPDTVILSGYVLHKRPRWKERIQKKLPDFALTRNAQVFTLKFSRIKIAKFLQELAEEFFIRSLY